MDDSQKRKVFALINTKRNQSQAKDQPKRNLNENTSPIQFKSQTFASKCVSKEMNKKVVFLKFFLYRFMPTEFYMKENSVRKTFWKRKHGEENESESIVHILFLFLLSQDSMILQFDGMELDFEKGFPMENMKPLLPPSRDYKKIVLEYHPSFIPFLLKSPPLRFKKFILTQPLHSLSPFPHAFKVGWI